MAMPRDSYAALPVEPSPALVSAGAATDAGVLPARVGGEPRQLVLLEG
ncbi:MAG: hypothetical protein ACE5F6_19475 [Anaerolineae bacterium]